MDSFDYIIAQASLVDIAFLGTITASFMLHHVSLCDLFAAVGALYKTVSLLHVEA
jgi:hypothetical protein